MDEEEPSRKRILESKEERIMKARMGTVVIDRFSDLLNMQNLTKAMIQQQMIMHGVDFEPNAIKGDLIMEVDRAVAEKRWADEIEELTIRKNLTISIYI